MLSIRTFTLLLATASAITLPKHDANTLVQDVANINKGVLDTTAAVNAFNGGDISTSVVEGTPVLAGVAETHDANRKGFVDALASNFLSESDSERVIHYVEDTVGYTIPEGIKAIEAKKPQFIEAGFDPLIIASLELLLSDHDTFSAAVATKLYALNATLTGEAVAVVAKIHDAIQGGIDFYLL